MRAEPYFRTIGKLRSMGGVIFAGIVMTAAVVGGIMAWDFILSNVAEALDEAFGDFSDADSRTAALRNALDEVRGYPSQTERGGGTDEGPGIQGTDAIQITSSVSHSERKGL